MLGFPVNGFGKANVGDVYRPTLDLNFVQSELLDNRITFTRSTTGTRTSSSGLIEAIAINSPRFDYDPVTLNPKGLLVEEQRTNLLLRSEEFDNASWGKSNATVTANAVVSPDGTQDADKLVEDINTAAHAVTQNCSLDRATLRTLTVYAKAAERTIVSIQDNAFSGNAINGYFDLSTATTSSIQSGLGVVSSTSIQNIGNGWYRCTMTGTPSSTSGGTTQSSIRTVISGTTTSYTGDGTSGLYIWGAQLEAGAFPTSYIPTVASQVTRAADAASMTGTSFSSWYNQSEGTLFAEGTIIAASGNRVFADIGNNGVFGTSAYIVQTSSGVSLAPAAAPVNMASSVGTLTLSSKNAVGLQANSAILASNGVLGPVDTSCSMPALATTLTIGNAPWAPAAQLNGTIRRITYYPRRLTNAELQAITS